MTQHSIVAVDRSLYVRDTPDLILSHSITESNLKLLFRLDRGILVLGLLSMGLSFRGVGLCPRWKQLPVRDLDVAQS